MRENRSIISDFPIGRERGLLTWHNPLQITIPKWSRPYSVRSCQEVKLDMEQLHISLAGRDRRWKDCMDDLSYELAVKRPRSPEALNAELLRACLKHFPQHVAHTKSIEGSHATKRWDIWRQLNARAGAGLHAIFKRWGLYCRFRQLSRRAHAFARERRKKRLLNIIDGAKNASQKQNLRELYSYVRKLSPKKLRRKIMLRSKDGSIMHPKDELELLRSYFQGLFRQEGLTELDLSLCHVRPYVLDCVDALSRLPARKAVPRRYAPQIAWKSFAATLGPYLDDIYRSSYESGLIPKEWKASWLVLVPKPNKSGSQPSDWRPISLQDPGGKCILKMLSKMALNYVWNTVTSFPQYAEYAYMGYRGTSDAISRVLDHCHRTCAMARSATPSVYERKLGSTGSACKGGLQLCIDLRGAFDKASRELIHQALQLLHLPETLQVPLLAWYQQNQYHITHSTYSCTIESNIGVRQGCVAAPMLWICFMHLWQMHLVGQLSREWVIKCLTIFADDIHACWTFTCEKELEDSLKAIRIIFNTLSRMGMEVNLQKTVCLLRVFGSQATKLRKKYCCHTKTGKFIRIPRVCVEDGDIKLPLVDKHVYLGVVISYGSFAVQTLRHRIACAQKSFMTLRPWWTKNKLALHVRVQLWRSCVWSSLVYGLCISGLDHKSKHLLMTTVMKQLRWLSQESLREGLRK